jgi:hypothetical protein
MEILYETFRESVPNDHLRIRATEQEFNETAEIDIQWNEIPDNTNVNLKRFFRDVQEAVKNTINNRQTLKQETKIQLLQNKISQNINTNIQASVSADRVAYLQTRIY